MSRRALVMVCILAVITAWGARGEDLEAVLRGSYVVARTPQATVRFRMTIHEQQGEKTRELIVALTNTAKGGNLLARVVLPASLSAMKYLRIETEGGALQQWLATSRGVRRLGESGGDERLFGSDFMIDDFARFDPSAYKIARLIDKEKPTTWMLSLQSIGGTPRRRVLEIDRASSLIMAADSLDGGGKITRSYRVEAVAGSADSPYPRLARMSDPTRGSWTLLEVLTIDLTTPILDRAFNPVVLQ